MNPTSRAPAAATGEAEWFGPGGVRFASVGVVLVLCLVIGGCTPGNSSLPPPPVGVELQSDTFPALHERLSLMITSAPAMADWKGGLVGATGGARVRLLQTGEHELISVVPQLTATQIPISYAVTITPQAVAAGLRLSARPGTATNVMVRVRLRGDRGQEVQINWSAVVLIVPAPTNVMAGEFESYRRETACAQSSAKAVMTLAGQLWPENGTVRDFAISIQDHIGSMQQHTPPKSMDAVGILGSGGNWICTANANLATALLRARGVPARSLAVIPPTGQRLEMHRIVEYHDNDEWLRFDPSSIHRDVPMHPWHSVVMATSTPEDEDRAMKPRMGTSLGAPYGQELEFVSGGLTFSGQDFFWTTARPLAGFETDTQASTLARQAWNRFLETGQLSAGQLRAASATNAAALLEALSE